VKTDIDRKNSMKADLRGDLKAKIEVNDKKKEY